MSVDLFRCPVCLETYQDPVLLPACGHTFCRRCVDQIVAAAVPKQLPPRPGQRAPPPIKEHCCPTCRAPFQRGIPNYALRQLVDDGPQVETPKASSASSEATTKKPQMKRSVTRELNRPRAQSEADAVEADPGRVKRLQKIGVSYGLAKLLDEEDRKVGQRIFLLDNSGSTSEYDGKNFQEMNDGTMRVWPCTRWEEIKATAMEHALWNAAISTPCEFVLLNPGPGVLQEGRDYVRMDWYTPGEEAASLDSLNRMLGNTFPQGLTPLVERLDEIYARIKEESAQLLQRGQRVVLVIVTDGLPTGASGDCTPEDKRGLVNIMTRLMTELQVTIVIRLTTSDASVVEFYAEVDEELELPLDILDDIESEAKEIQKAGNGWFAYSPLLHRIREGGTFVKLFDLLDERSFSPTEVAVFSQLILRQEGDPPMPGTPTDFCAALEAKVAKAARVYDPIRQCMAPQIYTSQVNWMVLPAKSRIVSTVRTVASILLSPFSFCTSSQPETHVETSESRGLMF